MYLNFNTKHARLVNDHELSWRPLCRGDIDEWACSLQGGSGYTSAEGLFKPRLIIGALGVTDKWNLNRIEESPLFGMALCRSMVLLSTK
jgi:hypothetical protein